MDGVLTACPPIAPPGVSNPSPPGPGSLPMLDELPKPSDEKLPAGGVTSFWSSGGTGAYSRVSEGALCGRFNAEGRIASIASMASPAATSGG